MRLSLLLAAWTSLLPLCQSEVACESTGSRAFGNLIELTLAVNIYIITGGSDGAIRATYGYPMGCWDVSEVTSFTRLFEGRGTFNEDISDWDVSLATNMDRTFLNSTSFNQPLDSWNVQSVTSASFMFANAGSFNQDISSWNFQSLSNLESIFNGATSFSQDLCSWRRNVPLSLSSSDITNAFHNTGCPLTDNPVCASGQVCEGPFCFDCTTSSPTQFPSNSPTRTASPTQSPAPTFAPTRYRHTSGCINGGAISFFF
jgi:hypothetical protein